MPSMHSMQTGNRGSKVPVRGDVWSESRVEWCTASEDIREAFGTGGVKTSLTKMRPSDWLAEVVLMDRVEFHATPLHRMRL
jgi:hypothetical protein